MIAKVAPSTLQLFMHPSSMIERHLLHIRQRHVSAGRRFHQLPAIDFAIVHPLLSIFQNFRAMTQQGAFHPNAMGDDCNVVVRLPHQPSEELANPPYDIVARLAGVRPPIGIVLSERRMVRDGGEARFEMGEGTPFVGIVHSVRLSHIVVAADFAISV